MSSRLDSAVSKALQQSPAEELGKGPDPENEVVGCGKMANH